MRFTEDEIAKISDLENCVLEVRVVFSNWDNALKRWPRPGWDAIEYRVHRSGRIVYGSGSLPWTFADTDLVPWGVVREALRKMIKRTHRSGRRRIAIRGLPLWTG